MRSVVLFLLPFTALGQYTGPVPEKEDLPYIVQADNLIPTEATTANEEKGKKDERIYTVAGAASSSKTPLASPIFLMKVRDLVPEKLKLYRLEVRNGRREITFRSGKKAKNPEPLRVDIKHVREGLVRLEVTDSLPKGQYSFSPDESNAVFCFEVD